MFPAGIWFAWPVNIPLLPVKQTAVAAAAAAAAADAVPKIISATAQLTTHAALDDGTIVLFFVETPGIAPEVSLGLGSGTGAATVSGTPGCSASTEQGDTVLRGIKAVREIPPFFWSHFILQMIIYTKTGSGQT